MSIFKPRRILAGLGVIVLVIGGYVGWQVYQGQQMAKQYAADAQTLSSSALLGSTTTPSGQAPSPTGSSENSSARPSTAGLSRSTSASSATGTSGNSSASPSPAGTSGTSSVSPSPTGSPEKSSTSSPATGTPSAGEYKALMTKTYQGTLQAMQNVKSVTLALQSSKLSISAYRSSILQSQATFSSAVEYVRANPPTDKALNPYYQEFLAGISLANESMGVVLNGISSFSPSSLYAAREMGKKAQQQVINGYSHL